MSIGKIIPAANFANIGTIQSNKEISSVTGSGQVAPVSPLSEFGDLLKSGVNKVSDGIKAYEDISQKFSQGEKINIHELMVKGEQADIQLRLMVTMRNKMLEAYQEVMRLPV